MNIDYRESYYHTWTSNASTFFARIGKFGTIISNLSIFVIISIVGGACPIYAYCNTGWRITFDMFFSLLYKGMASVGLWDWPTKQDKKIVLIPCLSTPGNHLFVLSEKWLIVVVTSCPTHFVPTDCSASWFWVRNGWVLILQCQCYETWHVTWFSNIFKLVVKDWCFHSFCCHKKYVKHALVVKEEQLSHVCSFMSL